MDFALQPTQVVVWSYQFEAKPLARSVYDLKRGLLLTRRQRTDNLELWKVLLNRR